MFLGIEIGGTKLQLGVGPGDGTIAALERAAVDPAAGAAGIRRQILELAAKLLAKSGLARSDIRAVGIGFGGPVRSDLSTVTKSHQIAGWDDFPLGDWSRRELGWSTIVHNDADTAGLAEACYGAGRGCSPVFYITIGSGIGGGLIIGQSIYRGAGAGAGEIGHLCRPRWRPVFVNPPVLEPPQPRATVESVCSGWSVERRVQFGVRKSLARDLDGPNPVQPDLRLNAQQLLDSTGGDLALLKVESIVRAAREGNALAAAYLQETWRVLGWAIGQMITLLCPRRVVLGGGVAQIGEDLFLAPVREATAQYVFPPFADSYEIVPAALGESVVVHGALRLAHDLDRDRRNHR